MKKYIFTFFLLFFFYNLFLLLSSCFSSNIIENHIVESVEILKNEGIMWNVSKNRTVLIDNTTDAMILNECYSIDNDNPIYSYLSCRRNYKNGLTEIEKDDKIGELVPYSKSNNNTTINELEEFIKNKVTTSISYARYWHGYLVFFRPLLIFFNITQIRFILFIIEIFLLMYMLFLIKKEYNFKVMLIFFISFLLIDFQYIHNSLQMSPVFIITILSSIIVLKSKFDLKQFLLLLFITGSITSFVDYLTVPIISFALPTFLFFMKLKKSNCFENAELLYSYKILIKMLFIWGCGYAFTWISKWILYDLLYHKNLIITALSQIKYRTIMESELTTDSIGYVMILMIKNYITIIFIFLMCFGYEYLDNIYKYKISKKNIIYIIYPFIMISILPIIILIIMANHTTFHYFFTYRNFLVVCLGIFLSSYYLLEEK